jgi:hypothetical protein
MEQSHRGRCSRHVPALVALLAGAIVALASASPALAVGDANEAFCPNAAFVGFREYLPECGAYERVSPSFKNGNRINGIDAVLANGSKVISEAPGSFAGTQNNAFGATNYEFTRTPSGWQSAAIDPAASTFPAIDAKWFAVSTDLTRTLWGAREASQSTRVRNLYIREADGTFTEIGPTAPPSGVEESPAGDSQEFGEFYAYAGASDDLSHVLFDAASIDEESEPWPGDSTREGGESLYEYSGTGNTHPELVGVSDGSTVVDGKVVESGKLISDCGTFLGSQSNKDTYNAVSSDGETVFFTAEGHSQSECEAKPGVMAPEVDEVFARVDNDVTVPVSEPSLEACTACKTAVRSPAVFAGASSDGSKVLFLTEQELMAGASGLNLYEYDFDGPAGDRVVRISAGLADPEVLGVARLSEDGSRVYFVARGVLTGADHEGRTPVGGEPNLYVFDEDSSHPQGRLAFVATLSSSDSEDWQEQDERPVQASPDGGFLVFESSAALTGGSGGRTQVFEYAAENEELVQISISQTGYQAGAVSGEEHPSRIGIQEYAKTGFHPSEASVNRAVSENGHVVVFHSVAALTPRAVAASTANAESVYEYRSSGTLRGGEVFLISDGVNSLTPQGDPASLDPSGEDAFFLSIDQLVPEDGDQQFDLYDARSHGGFPEAAPAERCVGEACQGGAASEPVLVSPASVSAPGEESVPAPASSAHVPARKAKRVLSRAQLLAQALRACRAERVKRKRAACKARARERYGVKRSAKSKHEKRHR